jgi:hypothetical protein
MTIAKATTQQVVAPPIADPDCVKEVLVTELTGTCTIGPNVHMTWSVLRPAHVVIEPGKAEIKASRVVALRPVVPIAAIPDIIEQLRQVLENHKITSEASLHKLN